MIFLRFKAPPRGGDFDLDDLFLPRLGHPVNKAAPTAAAAAVGIPKPARHAAATPAATVLITALRDEPPVVIVCVSTTASSKTRSGSNATGSCAGAN